jgi:hypothetical protein
MIRHVRRGGPTFPAEDDIDCRATYLFGSRLVDLFAVRTVEAACAYMDSLGIGYARLRDGRIYTTPWHLLLYYYPHWTQQAGPLYPFDGFSMSLEDILKLPRESAHDCGVYFLFEAEQLVYIGKSTQIQTRFAAHFKDGRRWTDQRILDTAAVCAKDVEKYLIRQHLPPWNSRVW